MTIPEELKVNREAVLRLDDRHGASDVRVFGSTARGTARADSDSDLLVTAGPVTSPWFPVGLKEDLERLLGRNVDVLTEEALHWSIRDQVRREAIPL
ncbi:MAG: nucleotidyltransferase family protein [SAR324 cluster bacterium]